MSIRWSIVLDRLKPNCLYPTDSIYQTLMHLYHERDLSTADIASLTKGEASAPTIASYLKKLGIPMKPRGGPNNFKLESIPTTDYLTLTYKELAKKYGVSSTTIVRHVQNLRRNYIFPSKPRGRPKPKD